MRLLTSPSTSFQKAVTWQLRGYRTGAALTNHIQQHGGVVDPGCPACTEIVRKMDKANEAK